MVEVFSSYTTIFLGMLLSYEQINNSLAFQFFKVQALFFKMIFLSASINLKEKTRKKRQEKDSIQNN